MKTTFKFEVTFNLHTSSQEKIDKESIKNFQDKLQQFVTNYAGEIGSFYVYAKDYDTEVYPTKIKVKNRSNE